MANPQQRRKARSGTKKLRPSKTTLKRTKHKVGVVEGADELLARAWDKHKTVRQNYAALGLLPVLNPRQSGGLEASRATSYVPDQRQIEDFEEDEDDSSDDEAEEDAAPRPEPQQVGMARVIRDADGTVIGIELGGETIAPSTSTGPGAALPSKKDTKGKKKAEQTPWGKPLNRDSDDDEEEDSEDEDEEQKKKKRKVVSIGTKELNSRQGIQFLAAPKEAVAPKTAIAAHLQALASAPQVSSASRTYLSEAETIWVLKMYKAYGKDMSQWTRDRKKLNVMQRTVGECERRVAKIGGWEAVEELAVEAEAVL